MVAYSKLFSPYTEQPSKDIELHYTDGMMQLFVPVSNLKELSEDERNNLLLPTAFGKRLDEEPDSSNAENRWDEAFENFEAQRKAEEICKAAEQNIVDIQDVEIVSVKPKKKKGAPRIQLPKEVLEEIEAHPRYSEMDANCQASFRFYVKTKRLDKVRYQKISRGSAMRSQMKNWRDMEKKLIDEKAKYEKELRELQNDPKATKTAIKIVENKIKSRADRLSFRAPIMRAYDQGGAKLAIAKKRKLETENPENPNEAGGVFDGNATETIEQLKEALTTQKEQYGVALSMLKEMAKTHGELLEKLQQKESMVVHFSQLYTNCYARESALKQELKASKSRSLEYFDLVSKLRKDIFEQSDLFAKQKADLEGTRDNMIGEYIKLCAKLCEAENQIKKLEEERANDATLQWKMFDMEQDYKTHKDLLLGQIEQLEKDLKEGKEQFESLSRIYRNAIGKKNPKTDAKKDDEEQHANFDDGGSDDKWDERKEAVVDPENDRETVYGVIEAAKNGQMDEFSKHFDTTFVDPDDDEVAKMSPMEKAFLTAHGVQGIAYLAFDFASSQTFGETTYPDVDSFHKALKRCKDHEEYVERIFAQPQCDQEETAEETAPTENEGQGEHEIAELGEYGYENVIHNPEDPMEKDLLPLEPKDERRLKELQEKAQTQQLTEDEDFTMNELLAHKIIITRALRFHEARQEKQRSVQMKTDIFLTPEKVKVPLKHKLSDGQLKLIIRGYSIEAGTCTEHPFGQVLSSQTDIDKYYERYQIDEKVYPKDRK